MSRTISNSDDIIDSRDVIARIEELEGERQALADALEEAISAHVVTVTDGDDEQARTLADAVDEAKDELTSWDNENGDELKALQSLAEEAAGYAPDWTYGAALIRDSYFEDYARELVSDIGDLPRDIPSYIAIDWKATAENIQTDYTSVDYDGVTYWVR